MKYPLLLCASLMLAMPAVHAQGTPAPAQPAAKAAPSAAGCDRVKAHMQNMGDHMKGMGGSGMGCGHGMHGMHGMQGDKSAKGPQGPAQGGNQQMGDCMGRMSEMMKDMAPIAKSCDHMTPDMTKRLERHEKQMQEWRKDAAK